MMWGKHQEREPRFYHEPSGEAAGTALRERSPLKTESVAGQIFLQGVCEAHRRKLREELCSRAREGKREQLHALLNMGGDVGSS